MHIPARVTKCIKYAAGDVVTKVLSARLDANTGTAIQRLKYGVQLYPHLGPGPALSGGLCGEVTLA